MVPTQRRSEWLWSGRTVRGLKRRNEALEVVRAVALAVAEHDVVALVAVELATLGTEDLRWTSLQTFRPQAPTDKYVDIYRQLFLRVWFPSSAR